MSWRIGIDVGGTFTDVAESLGLAWGGRGANVATQGTVRPCVADVNNDGVADIMSANYGPNGLFLGSADGSFRDVSTAWGVAIDGRYDTCAPADIDHDGLLDLYVNGTVSATESFRDYLFTRTATAFVDATPDNLLALTASHGVQWADVDGDGALDLALAGSRPEASHPMLRHELPPAVAQMLIKAVNDVMAMPDIRSKLLAQGFELENRSPEMFTAFIKEQAALWAPVVKASGATL
jgi:hypothetical protein